jgi:hypothetical protein
MKKMKSITTIPGFTAGASLYNAIERHPAVATSPASAIQVVPQYGPRGLCEKAAYYCARGYQNWCDIEDKWCYPPYL